MRLLHTADWHAGKSLRGRPRLEELRLALTELLDIAARERVDCLLVAGDVFDSYAPAAESERLVYNFFAELVRTRISAVVIGGNHDHPHRLDALARLLDPLRIFVRGQHPGGMVELESGSERAVVAALPWVPERLAVPVAELRASMDSTSVYADAVAAHLQQAVSQFRNGAVNLVVAHLHIHGALVSGSERASHVTMPYALPARCLPEAAHYIALGHLHRPQQIDCRAPCHYAGSPLQLDFGEAGQSKRILLIDARAGARAHVESIPLTAGRRLRDVSLSLDQLRTFATSAGDDFLRVTLDTPHPLPGFAAELRRSLPNAVDIRHRSQEPATPAPLPSSLEPAELFAAFYRTRHNAAPPRELIALFRELYEEVAHTPR